MSNQEDLEQRIREQRTVEANKKNLVGQGGKIGVVLQMMGQPIIAQMEGGGYIDTNYIDTQGYLEDDEPRNNLEYMRSIPSMSVDGNERPSGEEWSEMDEPEQFGTAVIGWHFDGLSRGMHMEIKYDEASAELSLHHRGYPVYRELKGEIMSYIPGEEWERWIETLYKSAKEMRRKQQESEFEQRVKEAESNKEQWWKGIIARWGSI
jgi:hypothetical protein